MAGIKSRIVKRPDGTTTRVKIGSKADTRYGGTASTSQSTAAPSARSSGRTVELPGGKVLTGQDAQDYGRVPTSEILARSGGSSNAPNLTDRAAAMLKQTRAEGSKPFAGSAYDPATSSKPGPTLPAPVEYSLSDRYKEDRNRLKDLYEDEEKPDEGDIRDEYRRNAQASVNAINSRFASVEARDNATVDLMNREERAQNVLSGLSGSRTGGARVVATAQEGQAIKDRTAAQKEAEVQSVLADAETRASEEFQQRRTEWLNMEQNRYTAEEALNKRIREQAQAELAVVASSMTYEDLEKTRPDLLAQYQQETGLTETGLKAMFLASAKDNLLSETPTIIGNKAVWFTQKPDGTIGKTEVDIPDAGKEIKDSRITDAGIQVLYNDGTYEVLGGGAIGDGGTGAGLGTKDAEWEAARQFISDNPDASPSELNAYLRQNTTKLADGDISTLITEAQETGTLKARIDSDKLPAVAEAIWNSAIDKGWNLTKVKAYVTKGKIGSSGKEYELTDDQKTELLDYIQGQRSILDNILPFGR